MNLFTLLLFQTTFILLVLVCYPIYCVKYKWKKIKATDLLKDKLYVALNERNTATALENFLIVHEAEIPPKMEKLIKVRLAELSMAEDLIPALPKYKNSELK